MGDKNRESIHELSDNIKRSNVCVTGIPRGEKSMGQKKYLKK